MRLRQLIDDGALDLVLDGAGAVPSIVAVRERIDHIGRVVQCDAVSTVGALGPRVQFTTHLFIS